MGWLIALVALIALGFLPLGFRAIYREKQPGVWLLIGPLRLRIYPGKPKEDKEESKLDKKPDKSVPKSKEKTDKEKNKGGSYQDFLPVVKVIFEFLEEFRRKIRVNCLEMKLVMAGDDPSDLAVNYGKTWAVVGGLMTQLERFFVIKKRDVDVACDFTSEKTSIYVRLDATITLGRTLHLLSWHGARILKHLLKLRKLRKGGAKL